MANIPYAIKSVSDFDRSVVTFYLCDTDGGKPTGGFNAGDLCWTIDTAIFYCATSGSAWAPVAFKTRANSWSGLQAFIDGLIALNQASPVAVGYIGMSILTSDQAWLMPDISGLVATAGGTTVAAGANATAGTPGKLDVTARTTGITSTQLVTTVKAGMYAIFYTLECTTADVAETSTVTATFGWTDDVGAATYVTKPLVLTAVGRLIDAAGNADDRPLMFYAASGNITALTTVSIDNSTGATAKYAFRCRPLFLG